MGHSYSTHTSSRKVARRGLLQNTNLLIVLILGAASIILMTFLWRATSLPADTGERSRTPSNSTSWSRVVPLPPPAQAPTLIGGAEKSYLIAMSDYRNADYGKASASLRLATQSAPQDAELRMYLGSCLLMTHDYGAAIQELRTASQLATGDRKDLALILLAKAQLERAEVATARETLTQVAMNNGAWSGTARALLDDFSSEP